jgi:hypothetical protein
LHGWERYLAGKFGDALDEVRAAMKKLAAAFPRDELANLAPAKAAKRR